MHGCVQTSQGNRTRNRTVITEELDYSGTGRAYSNVNGDFSVPMRRDGPALLRVQGGTETTAQITVGPSATDVTLPECLPERGVVTSAPTIVAQPANVGTPPNTLARFAVVADGTLPLAHQWRRNGAAIPGATSTSYSTPALTLADNGATYSAVVSNNLGSATSGAALLSVTNTASADSYKRPLAALFAVCSRACRARRRRKSRSPPATR